jgi:hypothetical protein
MVATAVLLDVQTPLAVVLDNVVVDPVHTAVVPVIDATTGNAVTLLLHLLWNIRLRLLLLLCSFLLLLQ